MSPLHYLLLALLLLTACTKPDVNDGTGATVSSVTDRPKAFGPQATKADLIAQGVPHVTVKETTFFIGYQQVSANNQNPIFMRFDGDDMTYVRTDYETTGDDNKGYGLIWDGGAHLYAVFSATGTQGDPSEDFRRFATQGWLSSYGRGGGPKVTVLARINPDLGTVMSATYLRSELSSGNSNSFVATGLEYSDQTVLVKANAWFSPLGIDGRPLSCNGNSPFEYRIELDEDLTQAISVGASDCQ